MTPANYSFSWAADVVYKVWQKHARVREDFRRIWNISDNQLAKLIATGRPEWPVLRRVIQVMDNWEQKSPGCWTYYSNVKYLGMGSPFSLPDNVKKYLDKRLELIKLEEQGSREGR